MDIFTCDADNAAGTGEEEVLPVRKLLAVPVMAMTMAATAAVPQWHVQPSSGGIAFLATGGSYKTEGKFTKYAARIRFDPSNLAASSVVVAIDLNSVATGQKPIDDMLKNADWFSTATAPQAVFTAKRFDRRGDGSYFAHGMLKIKGVSLPVNLPFDLSINGKAATVSGKTSIDRTAWNIGNNDKMANDQVDKSVTISINLNASAI